MLVNWDGLEIIDPAEPITTAAEKELLRLLATRYTNAPKVLRDVLDHCSDLLVARDHTGISSMYAVCYEELDLGQEHPTPTLYLGPSASRRATRTMRSMTSLYLLPLVAAGLWERTHHQPLTLWGTTANPSIASRLTLVLNSVIPHQDGSYDDDSATIAGHLWQRLGAPSQPRPGAHPFVRSTFRADVQYSPDEGDRIGRWKHRRAPTTIQHLNVDATSGDRLLFLARVPDRFASADFSGPSRTLSFLTS